MKALSREQQSDWIQWIVRNKLHNATDKDLVERMLVRGFADKQAVDLISAVASSDIFKAAQSVAWRMQNLQAIADVQLALQAIDSEAQAVERTSGLSSQEFFQRFYVKNRPVVVTDLLGKWIALRDWSCDYFRRKYGHVKVRVQTKRQSLPVYEVFLKGHTEEMSLSGFIDAIDSTSGTNEIYLTANDGLLEIPDMRSLYEDMQPFPEFVTIDRNPQKQFVWFGPGGAVSPVHRDKLNVLMTQVVGRKRVKLISAQALHRMYNFESFFSEVDVEQPDLERFPLFAGLKVLDVTLEPGDALFIPVGWWHHVRALETSINVSFTNFTVPNEYRDLFPASTQRG